LSVTIMNVQPKEFTAVTQLAAKQGGPYTTTYRIGSGSTDNPAKLTLEDAWEMGHAGAPDVKISADEVAAALMRQWQIHFSETPAGARSVTWDSTVAVEEPVKLVGSDPKEVACQ